MQIIYIDDTIRQATAKNTIKDRACWNMFIYRWSMIISLLRTWCSLILHNVKLGLIIPAVLINPLCPNFFCNLKRGGPQGLINRLAGTWLINPLCWNPLFYPTLFISNSIYFQLFFTFFLSSLLYLRFKLIIENFKNNYSPNDRFLIKILIKIISLDSSQRVPHMSPCPPLIITMVCPWLINHLSDPWDFNNSNGILLRSNWRKPYPKFYGSELLIIKGWSRKLARRSDWPTRGGGD
jgi:hypothetical protein